MKKSRLKRIKMILVLCFMAFAAVAFVTNRRMMRTVEGYAAGPPAGVTGAPGEENCAFCHGPLPGFGQFIIIPPATYTPGQTYQIIVRHTTPDTSRRRWGFELTALDAAGASAGSFANLSQFTKTFFDGDFQRFYIEHNTVGTFANQTGGAQWVFNWIAPATNMGTVTFYANGNQANNDGTANGDQIYSATATTDSSVATPTPTPSPSPTPTATPTPTPTPTPSASLVTVGGKVLTSDLRGLRNTTVSMTDPQNVVRTATTSSFGFFSFDNVATGATYVFRVQSKLFRFSPQTVRVDDNIALPDFIGLE